jgi:mannose-6-phosphate isomerase
MEADGERFELGEGAIYFVAPGVRVKWATEKGLEVYMAVV